MVCMVYIVFMECTVYMVYMGVRSRRPFGVRSRRLLQGLPEALLKPTLGPSRDPAPWWLPLVLLFKGKGKTLANFFLRSSRPGGCLVFGGWWRPRGVRLRRPFLSPLRRGKCCLCFWRALAPPFWRALAPPLLACACAALVACACAALGVRLRRPRGVRLRRPFVCAAVMGYMGWWRWWYGICGTYGAW